MPFVVYLELALALPTAISVSPSLRISVSLPLLASSLPHLALCRFPWLRLFYFLWWALSRLFIVQGPSVACARNYARYLRANDGKISVRRTLKRS